MSERIVSIDITHLVEAALRGDVAASAALPDGIRSGEQIVELVQPHAGGRDR
ncbi:MAG: hypothetical protein LBU78_09095 [Microbacterium sp.]|jgi:hypothetical protein|nr:hypothetical protein [Microbacterium sp.]